MRLSGLFAAAFTALLLTSGCKEVNDDRIPYRPVYIEFSNRSIWEVYGVGGYGESRRFIKDENSPEGFFYTTTSATGYGGVLLIWGFHPFNNEPGPLAYDLACPVERNPQVRVNVLQDNLEAECPVCHSRYNVINRGGAPLAGEALQKNYGLKRYEVYDGAAGTHLILND